RQKAAIDSTGSAAHDIGYFDTHYHHSFLENKFNRFARANWDWDSLKRHFERQWSDRCRGGIAVYCDYQEIVEEQRWQKFIGSRNVFLAFGLHPSRYYEW